MNSTNYIKKKCNIFIPRNIYSLFLILSKKKSYLEDNYILINKNDAYANKFPNKIIDFLKDKKFKIIYVHKNYSMKKFKSFQNSFINRLFKINFFINLNQTSNEILKTKYEEFNSINLYNYKSINIYFGSSPLYYSNLVKKYKNVNLIFLEHGMGNFLSFVEEKNIYYSSFKLKIANFIKTLFFKLKRIYLPKSSYYYGIYGEVFKIKKLEYNNHKIKFLNLNYKKGFNLLLNFYKKDLNKIKRNKKINYIYLNIPIIYDIKEYKKFLSLVINSLKPKKNYVVLLKLHPRESKEKVYTVYLKKYLRNQNIKFYLLNNVYDDIPVEIILKFLSVKEIYSSYSSILFSIFYFCSKKIKLNAFFSYKIKKKWKERAEHTPNTLNFIKENYLNNNLNIVSF